MGSAENEAKLAQRLARFVAIDLPVTSPSVRTLTSKLARYVLCNLDQVPIYVGQSTDVHSIAGRTAI